MTTDLKHGDFTGLAQNYAKYRPGYSPFILETVMAMLPPSPAVADVGAGTGIWAKMLADASGRVTAVEPNKDMREAGMAAFPGLTWVAASAEDTTLPAASFDLVSMASSFHWPDFSRAVFEFKKILKPSGFFLALWNTREINENPLLMDIEQKIYSLVPGMKRVSSGRSEFCDTLSSRLKSPETFSDVLYLEGFHTERQTPEHYKGLWESVNDIRVQAGPKRFQAFMDYIAEKIDGMEYIEAKYKTRAWLAKK